MPARSEPRPPRRTLVLLAAFLAGALGGLLMNWRVLAGAFGLLPQADLPLVREVRREVLVEESARTAAVQQNLASTLAVFAREDLAGNAARAGAQVAGTAVLLTDDGVFLVRPAGKIVPAALAALTRDGHVVALTVLGADPWSSTLLARGDLKNVPALEVKPVGLAAERPRLGQELVSLTPDQGGHAFLRVAQALCTATETRDTLAPIGSGGAPFQQLTEPWIVSPETGGAIFDLSGGFVGFALPDDSTSVSAASYGALLAAFQRTGAVARPTFGIQARSQQLSSGGLFARDLTGAEVSEVETDGPFVRAGGQRGDVILAVNGRPLTTEYSLLDAFVRQLPEQPVDLLIRRGDAQLTLHLTTGRVVAESR
jgi:S1-C subfamily serine protease